MSEVFKLTAREHEVFVLIAQGYQDKEIAAYLGIQSCTVHKHVRRILTCLQVSNRTAAAARYWQQDVKMVKNNHRQ